MSKEKESRNGKINEDYWECVNFNYSHIGIFSSGGYTHF